MIDTLPHHVPVPRRLLRAATAMRRRGHRRRCWPRPAPSRRAAPRGRPSTPRSRPVNNLPNPYETVRNFGHAARRPQVGLGQRHPGRHRRQAHLGRRPLRHQFLRRIDGRTRSSSSIPPARSWPSSAPGRSCGRTAWTSTSRATSGSSTRASASAEELKKFPDAAGKGHTVAQVQPAGQAAADPRHAGRGRRSAGALHRAERRRRRPRRQHLRGRGAQRAVPRRGRPEGDRPHLEVHAPTASSSRASAPSGSAPASSAARTRWRSTRRAGCSSPIAATGASRSSIRTASTSTPGISSAASAAWPSPPTTRSTPSTRSRTTTTTPAGARACASAAPAPARSGTSCPSTCRSRPRAWAATDRWARA